MGSELDSFESSTPELVSFWLAILVRLASWRLRKSRDPPARSASTTSVAAR